MPNGSTIMPRERLAASLATRGAIASCARAAGMPYSTVWRHVHGGKRITAEQALRYEAALGIPRSQLRPDLWPPEPEPEEAANHDDRMDEEHL